jgi:hypothetical protein
MAYHNHNSQLYRPCPRHSDHSTDQSESPAASQQRELTVQGQQPPRRSRRRLGAAQPPGSLPPPPPPRCRPSWGGRKPGTSKEGGGETYISAGRLASSVRGTDPRPWSRGLRCGMPAPDWRRGQPRGGRVCAPSSRGLRDGEPAIPWWRERITRGEQGMTKPLSCGRAEGAYVLTHGFAHRVLIGSDFQRAPHSAWSRGPWWRLVWGFMVGGAPPFPGAAHGRFNQPAVGVPA